MSSSFAILVVIIMCTLTIFVFATLIFLFHKYVSVERMVKRPILSAAIVSTSGFGLFVLLMTLQADHKDSQTEKLQASISNIQAFTGNGGALTMRVADLSNQLRDDTMVIKYHLIANDIFTDAKGDSKFSESVIGYYVFAAKELQNNLSLN